MTDDRGDDDRDARSGGDELPEDLDVTVDAFVEQLTAEVLEHR